MLFINKKRKFSKIKINRLVISVLFFKIMMKVFQKNICSVCFVVFVCFFITTEVLICLLKKQLNEVQKIKTNVGCFF